MQSSASAGPRRGRRRIDTRIEDSRPAGDRMHGDVQFIGA